MSKFSSDLFSCISDSFLKIVGFPLVCEVFSNVNTFETLVYPVVQGLRHQCYTACHRQTSFSTGDYQKAFCSSPSGLLNPRRLASAAPIRGISHLRCGPFGTFGSSPVCNLEVLLVNFEVSLRVSAYRADFRCLGTHNDMSAIAALPNFHL